MPSTRHLEKIAEVSSLSLLDPVGEGAPTLFRFSSRTVVSFTLSGRKNVPLWNRGKIFRCKQAANNFLLTEREGRTGEYWPEVVAVRTERNEVRTKRPRANIPQYGPEQVSLVSSLLYGFLITFCFVFASP